MGKRRLRFFHHEKGYLLFTTIIFLVFAGLFSHSLIKVSSHQILQLKQFSIGYEAKATLEMGETILENYLYAHDKIPESGKIEFSNGTMLLNKRAESDFILELTLRNGHIFQKDVSLKVEKSKEEVEEIPESDEEKEIEEGIEIDKEDIEVDEEDSEVDY